MLYMKKEVEISQSCTLIVKLYEQKKEKKK